ncbi:MAG: grasp-with-spasm system ATP-grasp peptide maturase [Bacteroidia bacterium]
MVIISSQNSDVSTGEVMDWLRSMGKQVYRINGESFEAALGNFQLQIGTDANPDFTLETEGRKISSSEINAFWFRRSAIDETATSRLDSLHVSPALQQQMAGHMGMEATALQSAFFTWLSDKNVLGNFQVKGLNKLAVLRLARQSGLDIPATIVTNSRENLLTFARQYPEMITKCISEVRPLRDNGKTLGMYTSSISLEDAQTLPEYFAPSLFQENIQKAFEIRIFYLDGEMYPMAIFSQLDPTTAVDFRQYNHEKNNRTVPYALPQPVREKITFLMEQLSLNTGSIDIIRSVDRRYVFLEVNPVGQFGMVSKPCNYFLEKKIAQFLTRTEN